MNGSDGGQFRFIVRFGTKVFAFIVDDELEQGFRF